MSNGSNIPVMVVGSRDYPGSTVVVGTEGTPHFQYLTPRNVTTTTWWYLVLDLGTLTPVVDITSSTMTAVPPDVAKFVGKPGYLLIASSVLGRMDLLPQGELYGALKSMGAGAQLEIAEDTYSQLGTGTYANYSYALACTTNAEDLPGFEAFDLFHEVIIPFELMPVTLPDGSTTYVPIQIT